MFKFKHDVISQADAVQVPRRMPFDHHVRVLHQPQEKPPAFLLRDVEGDTALIGVESKEERATVGMTSLADKGRFMPCRVPHSWRFDLYGGRTLIGQKLGAVGSGEGPRQFQHLYVF